ncbi:MAG: hypothetical protein ABI321_15775 [Polyangia bacterium]
MQTGLLALVVGVLLGTVCTAITFLRAATPGSKQEATVAMAWGDGKYGPAFYGARVYEEPAQGGLAVFVTVAIGQGNGYEHDRVKLGTVATHAEAVAKYGHIDFRPDGLHVGDWTMPRDRLESHR